MVGEGPRKWLSEFFFTKLSILCGSVCWFNATFVSL